MFTASDLTEEQKETVKSWVAKGAQMADVQKKLQEDLGFKVTYMDTRFLALDLELEFVKEEEPEPVLEDQPEAAVESFGADDIEHVPAPAGGYQPVSVTVDTVGRPGAMVSGRVSFSDGETGAWMVDNTGRMSLDPDTAGYRPSEIDIQDFQTELRKQMEQM